MAKGVYTVEFENISYTTANGDHDFFELRPGTTTAKPITLIGLDISTTTEVGDAQEEQVRYRIITMIGGTFTTGTGGATPTPAATENSDDPAEFAADTSNTVVATTTGTTVNVHSSAFNIRNGLQIMLPPEWRPTIYGLTNSAIIVRMLSTLADDASMSGTAYVKEGV